MEKKYQKIPYPILKLIIKHDELPLFQKITMTQLIFRYLLLCFIKLRTLNVIIVLNFDSNNQKHYYSKPTTASLQTYLRLFLQNTYFSRTKKNLDYFKDAVA